MRYMNGKAFHMLMSAFLVRLCRNYRATVVITDSTAFDSQPGQGTVLNTGTITLRSKDMDLQRRQCNYRRVRMMSVQFRRSKLRRTFDYALNPYIHAL